MFSFTFVILLRQATNLRHLLNQLVKLKRDLPKRVTFYLLTLLYMSSLLNRNVS